MRAKVGIGALGVLLASLCPNVAAAQSASGETDGPPKTVNDGMGVANSACAAQLMGSIQVLVGVIQSTGDFSSLNTAYVKQYWVQPPICPSLVQISYEPIDQKSAFVILSNLRTGACKALVADLQKDWVPKNREIRKVLINGTPMTNEGKNSCFGKNVSSSSLGQQNIISVYIPKSE